MEPEINEAEGYLAPLKKVTTVSKYLALSLFIVLPFLGGWIGYTYAPEKVVEVERVVIKEVVIEKEVETNKLLNDGAESRLSFTHPTEGYRFSYLENWRLVNNGYIQLMNYPEPVPDLPGWGDGHNKIEGGFVESKSELPDWNGYSAVEYGNKTVYVKKDGVDDGLWNWTSFALQLPSDSSKVIIFTIYGDTDNFDSMLGIFLSDFIFLSSGS